jgi:hypothetical protein
MQKATKIKFLASRRWARSAGVRRRTSIRSWPCRMTRGDSYVEPRPWGNGDGTCGSPESEGRGSGGRSVAGAAGGTSAPGGSSDSTTGSDIAGVRTKAIVTSAAAEVGDIVAACCPGCIGNRSALRVVESRSSGAVPWATVGGSRSAASLDEDGVRVDDAGGAPARAA